MCFKIVAECKEVFLEGFAVQYAKERATLFIRYLYPNDTRPKGRKSQKQWVQTCAKSDIEQFVDLGFSWPVHSSPASSAELDIV